MSNCQQEFYRYEEYRKNHANEQNWYVVFYQMHEKVSPQLGPYTLAEADEVAATTAINYNADSHSVTFGIC